MAKAALEEKAMRAIPEYMVAQNRPYSVTDVHQNLHGEFGKTLVQKALEAGAASGRLKEKVIGKQKLYYANQDELEQYDDSALSDYNSKIGLRTEALQKETDKLKKASNELRELLAVETTEQLVVTLKRLEEEVTSKESRCCVLSAARGAAAEASAAAERVMQGEQRMDRERNARKRIASDMLNAIRDGSNMSKKQLVELIGLDLDD